MADPELLQALDYILNKSDDSTIDVLVEAITRRRRDLTIFNSIGNIPDPQKMTKQITKQITEGVGGTLEGMKKSVQDMIKNLLKEHAPELSEKEREILCNEWLPDRTKKKGSDSGLPADVILSMIEQFIAFSHGEMKESTDKGLREEMGAWPERYWNSFPPVVQQIITDYLKNKIPEKDFKSRICIALAL